MVNKQQKYQQNKIKKQQISNETAKKTNKKK